MDTQLGGLIATRLQGPRALDHLTTGIHVE